MSYDDFIVRQEHSYRGWDKPAPRTCDITGEGMWEGFLLFDGRYIAKEEDLVKVLRSFDWSEQEIEEDMKVCDLTDDELVELSYDTETHLWTTWDE
jgi:hypothetical protein|tara:strand:+ start:251 stop:538 length:288 start_codon:yes stop_codon:yes gene_type:complete